MEFTLNLCEELLDRFEQITESVEVISERISGTDSVDILMSTAWGMTTLDSCVMRLQVIGELVRAIDSQTHGELFAQYPAIPWKKVIGLRNIISHEYANIDYDMIWEIFTVHLNPLAKEVDKIKEFLKDEIIEILDKMHSDECRLNLDNHEFSEK